MWILNFFAILVQIEYMFIVNNLLLCQSGGQSSWLGRKIHLIPRLTPRIMLLILPGDRKIKKWLKKKKEKVFVGEYNFAREGWFLGFVFLDWSLIPDPQLVNSVLRPFFHHQKIRDFIKIYIFSNLSQIFDEFFNRIVAWCLSELILKGFQRK